MATVAGSHAPNLTAAEAHMRRFGRLVHERKWHWRPDAENAEKRGGENAGQGRRRKAASAEYQGRAGDDANGLPVHCALQNTSGLDTRTNVDEPAAVPCA